MVMKILTDSNLPGKESTNSWLSTATPRSTTSSWSYESRYFELTLRVEDLLTDDPLGIGFESEAEKTRAILYIQHKLDLLVQEASRTSHSRSYCIQQLNQYTAAVQSRENHIEFYKRTLI